MDFTTPMRICQQCGAQLIKRKKERNWKFARRLFCGRACVALSRRGVRVAIESEFKKRHGGTGTPEYECWCAMKQRCCNQRNPAFPRYGGRGVTICERWRRSFSEFLADMGPRPSMQHSLDRHPKNDGNYEPGNVRWATDTEQARNTRANRLIVIDGRSRTLSEWAETSGISTSTLWMRLRSGMLPEKAISR